MDSLKHASLVSLACIVSTVLLLMGNGAWIIAHPEDRPSLFPGNMNITANISAPATFALEAFPTDATFLSALPIMSFAFLCHQNTFPIYKELKQATVTKMSKVGHWSMAICFGTYLVSGLFGYFTFVTLTYDDILKNYDVTDTYISVPMDILRVGFGLSICLSYPLMVWEARHNLDVLFFGHRPYTFKRHLGLNIGIVSVAAAVGIYISGIASVLSLVGSTCSPCMVYILPALFYLKVRRCCIRRVRGGLDVGGCRLFMTTARVWECMGVWRRS